MFLSEIPAPLKATEQRDSAALLATFADDAVLTDMGFSAFVWIVLAAVVALLLLGYLFVRSLDE